MTPENDVNPYQAPTAQVGIRPDAHILASRWARLGAVLVDGIIGLVLMLPLMFAFGYFQSLGPDGQPPTGALIGWTIFGLVLFYLVHGYLLYTRQQTVGKLLLNIKIVGTEEDKVGAGRLFGLRYLVFQLIGSVPLLNIFLLVDILMIFRKDRRCLHDLLAGTRVVEAPPGS